MSRRRRFRLAPFCLLALLCACSPVYVYQSASGHAKFLWRRQSIDEALADPKTPAALKAKLEVVKDVRRFAFERMGLRRSKDYGTFSRVEGPYLTYIVSGSEKTRFKLYYWRFPLVGAFPYKGYFDKKDAEDEKAGLERRGYDACLSGVAAYNVPLPFSNPVPSTALEDPPGELAGLIIHELTHGTVWYKNQVDFDESLATFAGEQGAQDFLTSRYGPDSKELSEFRRALERERGFAKLMDALYAKLEGLYGNGAASREDKLRLREEIFRDGEERFKQEGFELGGPLNNAVILAHRLYHEDLGAFREAFERSGRDWPRTIRFLKDLDRRDPAEDLRRKLAP